MRFSKLFIAVTAAALAGCADGANDAPIIVEPEPPTSFSSLVKGMFAETADNIDPVEVDELPLEFNDLENPAAFDELLQ